MHQITESIIEDGIKKVVAVYHQEHISDLAKDIAAMDKDTDDLEVKIADRIKRHIHQEKSSVYSRYKMYVKDLRFLVRDDRMDVFDNQVETLFDAKIETHNYLAENWKYGTKFSCATSIMRPPFAEILKNILDEKAELVFVGGAFWSPRGYFNFDGIRNGDQKWKYNSYEKFLLFHWY